MIARILVPTDGSDHAGRAVDLAADLAAKYKARLVILNVMSALGAGLIPEELRGLAEIERIEITQDDFLLSVGSRIVATAAERAYARGAKDVETAVEIGGVAKVIVDYAKNYDADLIVMGRRGLGRTAEIFLGSVSSKVIHLAECACLTVR